MLSRHQKLMFYYALLSAVCTGIIASIAILITTPHTQTEFLSISYTDPDALPSHVSPGSTNTVSYDLRSFHTAPHQVQVSSQLELYNLYDITEGLHSCLSPYRKRMYVGWTNSTRIQEQYESLFKSEKGAFSDLYITPNFSFATNWTQYHLEFSLSKTFGSGELVIWYEKDPESQILYTISFNDLEKTLYFNDQKVFYIGLEPQNNNIRIDYDDNVLSMFLNDNMLFTRQVDNATGGQFGFGTRNMYASINAGVYYKESKIEIPYKGNIIDVKIDDELYYKKSFEVRDRMTKEIETYRNYSSAQPFSCQNEFACSYLEGLRRSLMVKNTTISSVLGSYPRTAYGSSFFIAPHNRSTALIPWDNFTVNMTFDRLLSNDSLTLLFDGLFAVTITNNSVLSLRKEGSDVVIEQYPFQQVLIDDAHTRNLALAITGHSVEIASGPKKLLVDNPASLGNTTLTLFEHNTFTRISDLSIRSNEADCVNDSYSLCSLSYQSTSAFSVRDSSPEDFSQTRDIRSFPEVNKSDVFLTKVYSFNGPLGLIRNRTNVTFTAEFLYLDGEGTFEIAYNSLDGKPIIILTASVPDSTTSVQYIKGNTTYSDTARRSTPSDAWVPLSISIGKDIITASQNNSVLFSYRNVNVKDGYFSMSTINTQAEIRNAYLSESLGSKRPLPINDDPCALRLVYNSLIRNESVTLLPGVPLRLSDEFTAERDFDYGKFIAEADNLSIEVWMVRS